VPKGIYAAASAMVTETRALDVTAANLANAQSTGYRRQVALHNGFDQLLATRGRSGGLDGDGGAGIYHDRSVHNFGQGELYATGNPLDMGLNGDGFLRVRDQQDQVWLTRAGTFALDPTGRMVTPDGWVLEGQAGPIVVPADAGAVRIDANGRVYAEQAGEGGQIVSNFIDQVRISRVDQPITLLPRNGQYFAAVDDPPDADIGTVEVVQGHLERANVEPVAELVQMVAIQRRYEAAQRALTQQSQTGRGFSDLLRGA